MSNPITVTCPSCSRSIKVPLLNTDITPATYAQVHRYAQRADGGRSMNESEEALLSDLERVTAGRAELRALLHAEMAAHQTTAGERDDARAALEEAQKERDELLHRVFRTLHIGRRSEVLWGVVAAVFGLGSTRAQDLCERLGYDPHQRIGTRRRAAMLAADKAQG